MTFTVQLIDRPVPIPGGTRRGPWDSGPQNPLDDIQAAVLQYHTAKRIRVSKP